MKKRIVNLLIVDDEHMVADSLREMEEWSQRGVRVAGTALSGTEALARINREPIDIVITDIQMPDISGLELLQEIYKSNPEIAVIMISGYEDFTYAHTAIKYKAKGYVLKPIDTDELLEVFDEVLAGIRTLNPGGKKEQMVEGEQPDAPKTYHQLLVEETTNYAERHLSEPITLKQMARLMNLTPHYFGQIFKEVIGEYFTEYLTKLRMEQALELLKNPVLKNYEIARQIGLKDEKYFAKLFFRTYDMTPRAFRLAYFNRAQAKEDSGQSET